MNWHDAFLRQARSDEAIRRRLRDLDTEYCHPLHYLQMVTEKLAKAYQTTPTDRDPPPPTHNGFVRLLQTLKGQSDIQEQLGYNNSATFRRFIDSLLNMANAIQRLAPSSAGFTQPNPEYPWRDAATGEIHAPADFDFSLFSPTNVVISKLEKLVSDLLRIAS